jgi:hypothetical protein
VKPLKKHILKTVENSVEKQGKTQWRTLLITIPKEHSLPNKSYPPFPTSNPSFTTALSTLFNTVKVHKNSLKLSIYNAPSTIIHTIPAL